MKKVRNETKDLRQFGIVLSAILAVFGLVHFLKGRFTLYPWFFGVGLFIFCVAIIAPKALKGTYTVFMKLAHWVGWFNTRAILIFIYFVIMTPIALVFKILGKDPLNQKIDKDIKSYWSKKISARESKQQLEKQF